jgi:uncharacterized protein RhaS with RHS repeats
MLQRFISEDPIGLSGGLNLYAYADNNPTTRVDPFGTDWSWTLLCYSAHIAAGFGDTISFGGTKLIRSFTPARKTIDTSSGAYGGGQVGGVVFLVVAGGAGAGAEAGETALLEEGAGAEAEALEGESSLYEDITDQGSRYANRQTDITRTEFEQNLRESGFEESMSKDGLVRNFENGGQKYSVRDFSNQGSPTANYSSLANSYSRSDCYRSENTEPGIVTYEVHQRC